jgi:hypothetical protein
MRCRLFCQSFALPWLLPSRRAEFICSHRRKGPVLCLEQEYKPPKPNLWDGPFLFPPACDIESSITVSLSGGPRATEVEVRSLIPLGGLMLATSDRCKRSPSEYLLRHIQSTGGTAGRENASIDAGETEFCLEDHFRGHRASDHAHLPVCAAPSPAHVAYRAWACHSFLE